MKAIDFRRIFRKETGIYCLKCENNSKEYIGRSSKIGRRVGDHLYRLKHKIHENRELQEDFNLFGISGFSCVLLENCETSELISKEQFWINKKKPKYNKMSFSNNIQLTNDELFIFWKSIDIKNDNLCWNWIGDVRPNGYGRLSFVPSNTKCRTAHRIVYFIFNPATDQGSVVRHKCNNRQCCNPRHLLVGDYIDNMEDMIKDRRHWNQTLTTIMVSFIRNIAKQNLHLNGHDIINLILAEYGIKLRPEYFNEILSNRMWTDNTWNPIKLNYRTKMKGRGNSRRKWTEDETEYLIDNFNSMNVEEIAKKLRRSPHGVVKKSRKLRLKKINLHPEKSEKGIE